MRDLDRPAAPPVRWAGWFLLALLTAGSGCSPGPTPGDPVATRPPAVQDPQAVEQALRERAQVYWQAKRIHDEVTVYRMEAKALSKGSYTPQDHYLSRSNKLPILGFAVHDIQVNGDEAIVNLEVMHGLIFFGKTKPIKKQISDPWTFIDGQWYHGRAGKHKGQGQISDQIEDQGR